MSDDPTADFLAREKEILGDDADLFASGNAPSAPSGMDQFPDLDAQPSRSGPASPQKPSGIDAFPALDDDLLGGGGSSEVRVTGTAGLGEDPDREKFESEFPDISGEVPAPATAKPVFNALSPQPYGESPYPATAAPQARQAGSILPSPQFTNTLPDTEEDTEPIRQWKEKQAKEIEARNAASKAKRDEMANKAEAAIDEFYANYNKEKEKTIRENKEKEAEFVQKLKDNIAKGTTWERITDLVGLENSQSKTIRPNVPGGTDLTRMKEILLTLRREGDRAPGAAGF